MKLVKGRTDRDERLLLEFSQCLFAIGFSGDRGLSGHGVCGSGAGRFSIRKMMENDRKPLHLNFQTPRHRNRFNHFQPETPPTRTILLATVPALCQLMNT